MKQPNIIMILTDQHSGKVAGVYGDPWVRTPNIDRLAQNGVAFDSAYCNSPLCVPSRSSMLAGELPHHTGVFNNNQCLPSDKATFVHSLSAAGYETVLSGRMHFQGPDQRHGYEKRFVGDITTVALGLSFGKKRYGCFKEGSSAKRGAIECAGKGHSSVMAYDRDVAAAACDYLHSRDDTRPLFMTVGLYGPHNPYVAPEELFDYYDSILPDQAVLSDEERDNMHPFDKHFMEVRNIGHETAKEMKTVKAAYYGMVEYEDSLMGEVMKAVEETLDMEETIVVYTSDHGDCLGQHGLFWKSNMREGAVRIPMIFGWKNHIRKGERLCGPVSLVDLAPTFLEAAQAPSLPVMDGVSILPNLIEGTEIPKGRVVISEICDIKGDDPAAMICDGRYKLILYHQYGDSLYDLETDPEELRNLSENPAYDGLHRELKDRLLKQWNSQEICRNRDESLAYTKIMKSSFENQKLDMLYDEWKQEGKERNTNYLIVDGEKVE